MSEKILYTFKPEEMPTVIQLSNDNDDADARTKIAMLEMENAHRNAMRTHEVLWLHICNVMGLKFKDQKSSSMQLSGSAATGLHIIEKEKDDD